MEEAIPGPQGLLGSWGTGGKALRKWVGRRKGKNIASRGCKKKKKKKVIKAGQISS